MTDAELSAIAKRLERGCQSKGVSLSPWAERLQSDASALLDEVTRLRTMVKRLRILSVAAEQAGRARTRS